MLYTKKQINAGEGFFTSGEWTLVWRIGKDQYITTSKGEKPMSPNAELVAGGCLHPGGQPHAGTLREINWD